MLAGMTGGIVGIGPLYDVFVADTVGPSGTVTSHTFTNVNFGPDFTNRKLLVYIIAQGKTGGVLTPGTVSVSSFLVGGASGDTGTLNFWYWTGSQASTIFSGIQGDSFTVSGTTGTISFTTNIALNCSIIVFSMTGSSDLVSGSTNGATTNTSPMSNTLTLSPNTTLIVVGVQNSAATLTMSGVTKQLQFSHVSGYQCVYGYDSHMPSETNRAISITGSAGASAMKTDGWVW